MKLALRQTVILWISLLVSGGLILFILSLPVAREWMWQQSGESDFLPQLKSISDLVSDWTRPRLDLQTSSTIEQTHINPFGVNTFLEQEVELSKQEESIRLAKEAGFRWIRQEFPWEDIEIHGKGDFEDRRHEPYRSAWEKYDQVVELANRYEMQLIVRLSNPPGWTRSTGEGKDGVDTFAPPDNLQDFADFVSAVVSRYKGRIHYYQIWNEPNIYPEWGSYPINPEQYTQLLQVGATAARAADPDVVVIAGALAATINLQPDAAPPANSLSDTLFLQRMYDAGAAPYFDVMAMQAYGLYSGPTDQRMHPRVLNISHHLFIRDLMVKNGDGHKPIWIAEMNWNAAPDDVDPRYGRVTLEQQARYLPLAYQRVLHDWPWIGVANTWYLKRATDEWETQRRPEAYFRLLLPDFTPLPVYESMKRYTQSLPADEIER
ncbi:MAG: cellulase family glycosylhydrolase [Caldilineaceae bacterium]